jgi:protein-tyrosine-phosphatase/predicted ATP-grasp superfamily ATP-dependent carboligase
VKVETKSIVDHPATGTAANRKVLVLGDDTRSFLTTVRSLGRKGIEVHVAPIDMRSPALRSRYIVRVHRLPPYRGDGADWLKALRSLIAAERFDLILPCDDRTVLPIHAHRAELEQFTILAIPGPRAIEVLFNKENTKRLAADLGINLARTAPPQEFSSPAEVIRGLGSPVVAKPKSSFRLNALDRRQSVQIVDTAEELSRVIDGLRPDTFYYEEFFQGAGVGLSVLAESGTLLLAFQHHRVHEGARGGVSPYRVSAPLSRDLMEACEKIVGALSYTGLAMFEFRRNFTTGAWILLEVNARPWGSMPLPVALGVDFPFALFSLLVEGKKAVQPQYRTGIYGRNLVIDLRQIISEIALVSGRGRKLGMFAKWLSSFFPLLIGRERMDTIVWDDPRPGLVELKAFFGWGAGRILQFVPLTGMVLRAAERWKLRAALRSARKSHDRISLLFVCYGNICRSPFAERLMAKLASTAAGHVQVISAGTYLTEGRSCPADAVAAARRFGVDLADHRSRSVSDALIDAASVVFVFDESNSQALSSRFPVIRGPIIRLGLLTKDAVPSHQIADPYGQGSEQFDRSFTLIHQALCLIQRFLSEGARR